MNRARAETLELSDALIVSALGMAHDGRLLPAAVQLAVALQYRAIALDVVEDDAFKDVYARLAEPVAGSPADGRELHRRAAEVVSAQNDAVPQALRAMLPLMDVAAPPLKVWGDPKGAQA